MMVEADEYFFSVQLSRQEEEADRLYVDEWDDEFSLELDRFRWPACSSDEEEEEREESSCGRAGPPCAWLACPLLRLAFMK